MRRMDSPPVHPQCENCGQQIPPESSFCNKCGSRLCGETVASLDERLTKLEKRLNTYSHKVTTKQEYLEIDTAAKVAERVKKWTTTWLYFAVFPAVLLILVLTVVFGKGLFDLKKIAAEAKPAVEAVLRQARSTAQEAESTAEDALAKSKQTNNEVKDAQAAVAKVKEQATARLGEVESLNNRVKATQADVETLRSSLNAQSNTLRLLFDQVTAVKNSKNASDVLRTYPILGGHFAGSGQELIDPKQKEPGKTYVVLSLSISQQNKDKFKVETVAVASSILPTK